MKNLKIGSRFFIVLIFCVFVLQGSAQKIVEGSDKYIHPFEKMKSPVLEKYINGIAENCRIIGLGEVSHYTKECYEIKHQIIETLIQKGFDGLVLEVDFGQALIWNEYVSKGIGNLDSIIAESGWFTYRTEEFKSLIRDIRIHNENSNQVFQIFGMEMTAVNHNVDWLINYFSKNVKDNQEILEVLREERKTIAFQEYDKQERKSYWELFDQLSSFLKNNKEELKENGGVQDYAIANRITEIFRQFATYVSQDDFSLKVEFRDQFSARNTLWVLDNLGEESKIILWAHNGHVAKESVLFNYDILGHYLAKWFEEEYYAIGFSFNQGEFGAFSNDGFRKWEMPIADRSSITKDLQEFSKPYLLFDIRTNLIEDKNLDSYLRTKQLIRTDISESFQEEQDSFMEINLSKTYDAMIYIDQTNYPTTIDWKR